MIQQPSCRGDCGQGDAQCPHPGLCIDDDDPLAAVIGIGNALLLVAVGAGVGVIGAMLWKAMGL
jgi:hypothetical protein